MNKKTNKMNKIIRTKKAQVWVETVLYIGIGLGVIALLLAVVRPYITKQKDSIVIEQSMRMLDSLDSTILETRRVAGTTLYREVQLSRGELRIKAEENIIEWYLEDSRFMYSEPGQDVPIGRINALTREYGDVYTISLIIDYSDEINITIEEKEGEKILQKGRFTIWMENLGGVPPKIDFTII